MHKAHAYNMGRNSPIQEVLRISRYMGVISSLVYWAFVAWSIENNEWFSFLHNALSDLGSPEMATNPWIYNYGLVITSLLMIAFSIHLILSSRNKAETVGAAYISISAVFIAFIGVFHAGTRPHSFVSTYFFLQFFVGMLIYGLGSDENRLRYSILAIFALAILGTLIPWPSVALIETYEIALITAFTVLVVLLGRGLNTG